MTDHLPSELELADIEARHNAATPGPWGAYVFGGDTLIEIAAGLEDTGCGYRARRQICRLEDEPMDNDPAHREWTAEEDWAQVRADAEFIAHARGDVPLLLAALRHAHARIAELEGAQEQIRHLHKDSPMGPCPVCIDADGLAAGGDGLVPYPCPTGRLAGAQDFDPPHVRAGLASAPHAPSAPPAARVGVSPASEAAGGRDCRFPRS